MANPQDEIDGLRAAVAELTARVYRLEQKASVDAQQQPEAASNPPQTRTVPPPSPMPLSAVAAQLPPLQGSTLTVEPKRGAEELESTIGKLWLNRIGIFAILIGVSYFIKYAFDNGWIGPSGKITLGLLAGIGLVLWSERFRNQGYEVFSYSLKAVGIGTLYLSLWGAFQIYHLIPSAVAFIAMIVVTASTL
jgi:uncharacterized membrane protein